MEQSDRLPGMEHSEIDHVGIAVRSIDDALEFYAGILGFERRHEGELGGNRVVYLDGGGVDVELLEPGDDEGLLADHIAKRGEGLHHVAVEVPDVAAALDHLAEAGVSLIDEAPKPAVHGSEMAFVSPRSTSGVLLQLYEY